VDLYVQAFCAMETLGKEDKELDRDHPSEELLPFFQTLYSGDCTTVLTNENVLIVLKLAHKFDTTQLDAASESFLKAACSKLEAACVINMHSSPTPFVGQESLLKHLNLITALRIIHNLDSNVAMCLKARPLA
jgi:hypothetical protein